MTREEVDETLEEERERHLIINSNNNVIKSLRSKLTISNTASDNERVQSSSNGTPNFVEVTDLICSLELENAHLVFGNIKYIRMLASKKLDAIERDIIECYFGNGYSYRSTARHLRILHNVSYDHKRIIREIELIKEKLVD